MRICKEELDKSADDTLRRTDKTMYENKRIGKTMQ